MPFEVERETSCVLAKKWAASSDLLINDLIYCVLLICKH